MEQSREKITHQSRYGGAAFQQLSGQRAHQVDGCNGNPRG
jgi:hypothetical protein